MNPTETAAARARMTNEGGTPAQGSAAQSGTAQARTEQSVNKATAGAHQTIDQAREAVRPAMDKAASSAHAAVDSVGGLASNTAEAFDMKSDQLVAAKDELIKATRNYLQVHPVASIGMAVAAGYVLSRILSTR